MQTEINSTFFHVPIYIDTTNQELYLQNPENNTLEKLNNETCTDIKNKAIDLDVNNQTIYIENNKIYYGNLQNNNLYELNDLKITYITHFKYNMITMISDDSIVIYLFSCDDQQLVIDKISQTHSSIVYIKFKIRHPISLQDIEKFEKYYPGPFYHKTLKNIEFITPNQMKFISSKYDATKYPYGSFREFVKTLFKPTSFRMLKTYNITDNTNITMNDN